MNIPIQIINNTGTVNLGQTDSNWLILIAPIVAAIIGLYTIWFSKKQHDRNAMIDVFGMLHDDNQKGAENRIIEAYRHGSLYNNMEILNNVNEADVDIVSRNYDQVGLFVKRNLIQRDDYFQMFGVLTVVYHHMLFSHIKYQRIVGGEVDFRTYFTELSIACHEHWKKRGRLPRDPKSNDEIKESVVEQWKLTLERQKKNH